MKLTLQESQKIKIHLPRNWVDLIGEKIDWVVGDTMIRKIVNGDVDDKHGVIAIATEIALEEKEKEENLKNQLKQL